MKNFLVAKDKMKLFVHFTALSSKNNERSAAYHFRSRDIDIVGCFAFGSKPRVPSTWRSLQKKNMGPSLRPSDQFFFEGTNEMKRKRKRNDAKSATSKTNNKNARTTSTAEKKYDRHGAKTTMIIIRRAHSSFLISYLLTTIA